MHYTYPVQVNNKGGEKMDFMNRGNRPTPSSGSPAAAPSAPTANPNNERRTSASGKLLHERKAWRAATAVLFVSSCLIVLALLFAIIFDKPLTEGRFVAKERYQAVFLNGGQVYFGKIRGINDKHIRMSDIYYLRINQQVQPDGQAAASGEPELVKLGCELHRPEDAMVINRSQIIFWENLKADEGENTVPGAIKKYVESNPDGACAEPSQPSPPTTQGAENNSQPTGNTQNSRSNNSNN
jgi:hypothetical protein